MNIMHKSSRRGSTSKSTLTDASEKQVNLTDKSDKPKDKQADSGSVLNSQVDSFVSSLSKVDDAVARQTKKIKADSDDLTDKIIKTALPAIAGFIVSKVATIAWDAIFHKGHFAKNHGTEVKGALDDSALRSGDEAGQGILMGMLFAALTGALGSLTSALSTRGSEKIVTKRQAKRKPSKGKKAAKTRRS